MIKLLLHVGFDRQRLSFHSVCEYASLFSRPTGVMGFLLLLRFQYSQKRSLPRYFDVIFLVFMENAVTTAYVGME